MSIRELLDIYLDAVRNVPNDTAAVSTDTRSLKPGQIYFALKGENFDGDDFAEDAIEKGALYAVVNDYTPYEGPKYIRVKDTLKTLQLLAKEYARYRYTDVLNSRFKGVIAVTGTNGKTTTKELLRTALENSFHVLATEGNLNNDIGVPLTLLRISEGVDYAIVEMGASHPDDLKPLLDMANPKYGVITNVGRAHLQGFGSFEGVKYAKGQLYDYLARSGGTAFVNWDDPVLREMAEERDGLHILRYGLETEGYSVLPKGKDDPCLGIDIGNYKIHTHLIGDYNASNVLCALRVARFLGADDSDSIPEIEAYVPSNSRSQFEKKGSNLLIMDCYNANPSSMTVALENLRTMEHPRKVLMLGEMRELGPDSVSLHAEILEKVRSLGPDKVLLVGEQWRKAGAEAFSTSYELAAYLKDNPVSDSLILIKGSRGTRMEKVTDSL